MNSLKIELITDDDEGGFTARIPDLPAYGEGATEEAAIADLKEAVAGYIDSFGLEDALSRIIVPTVREVIWDLAGMSHG
jgi:predicted RNase H-like HicB family nuclease